MIRQTSLSLTMLRRWLLRLVMAIAVVVWAIWLRPTWLGGPASYVVVAGDSMLPTHADGTVVVSFASPLYNVGDIITFAVDVADARTRPLVIHRIVSGDAELGYKTQGDNRPLTDPWTVGVADIVGREGYAIPGVGQLLLLIRSPIVLASIGAGLATYVVLGWTSRPNATSAQARRRTSHNAAGSL